MQFVIPGTETMDIQSVVFDLNGTTAIDGKAIDGLAGRMEALRALSLNLFLFTGDTHGTGADIARELGLELRITRTAAEKAAEARAIGADTCAAIGNGKIDLELFRTVRLRIVTVQAEGTYGPLLQESDIVVTSIHDAIDLFLREKRMIATLRS
jgi:soluble P-type ATPase